MRRVLLAFFFCLFATGAFAQGGPIGPPYQPFCNTTFQSNFVVAATTQLVSGQLATPPHAIYVCGWHATTSTSATYQLVYGMGNNCANNQTPMTPALQVSVTAPAVDHIDFSMLTTPLSATIAPNLCLITGGNGVPLNLQFLLYFGVY